MKYTGPLTRRSLSINTYNTVNLFSLPYSFLNIFSSFIVGIQYIMHLMYIMHEATIYVIGKASS